MIPQIHSSFSTSALLGFVGGEQNLTALQASHVNGRRRLPNLFNSPGSYLTGRGFVNLKNSRIWDGPHAGVSVDPATLSSDPDASKGPKFTAAFSGTELSTTGPLAKLLTDHSRKLGITVAEGRVTTPTAVTIVELPEAPDSEEHPVARVNAPVIIPILASAAAAAGCGIIGDWSTFSMIVLGMACNGIASYALQRGDLAFTRPITTPGAPNGDGYLETGNEIIVLKGSESAVSSVTRGRFSLRFKSESACDALSTSGTILTFQCLAQLLVVPQGTIFGQFLFLVTMVVAWLYSAYVARQEKAAWGRLVFEDLLKAPTMKRYSLGTHTQAAVFLMQMLNPANVEEQLSLLIPNHTPVWKAWRQTVARRLQNAKPSFHDAELENTSTFSANEIKLLGTLYSDAQAAVDAFAKLNSKF